LVKEPFILIVTYIYSNRKENWKSVDWRCITPARAINKTGKHKANLVDICSLGKCNGDFEDTCSRSDIIIIHKDLYGQVLSSIQHWKAHDKVVIADFDKAYDLTQMSLNEHEFWFSGVHRYENLDGDIITEEIDPNPLTQFKWGLRLVDAATVSSLRLVEDWQSFTSVYRVPNYIDLKRYLDIRSEKHEGINIGWDGAGCDVQGLVESGVLSALSRVCLQRLNVKVVVFNNESIYKALRVPAEQKGYFPVRNIDIGIAPLAGCYDKRISWERVLEYLVMKIPWAASEGPPYYAMRTYGWMVNDTQNAWERVLFDMVDHLSDYKLEASGEPYIFGISQGIEENIENVLSIYSMIINNALN